MNDIETKIKELENKNKVFEKEIKKLEKRVCGPIWLWFFLPFLGHFIYAMIKLKKLGSEPYQSEAVKIKVEIAKNEIEIIKLKKRLEK